jgi:putative membrane protein
VRESVGDTLAMVNAILNGTCAMLLVAGRFAVWRKKVVLHRALMLSAFATSCLFLTSYLTRVALTGTHRDPHTGAFHLAYLAVLFSHMILAMCVVPLVLVSVALGLRGRFERHRRVARLTFPVWLYVSVTGVAVYLMLYVVPA